MSNERIAVVVSAIRLVPKKMAEGDMDSTAYELGLFISRIIEGDATNPKETIYTSQDPEATIYWIDDPKIGMAYVLVTGDAREDMAAKLRGMNEYYTIDEITRAARSASTVPHKMGWIYRLALAAPDELDPAVLEIFTKYFQDEHADVRGAAVLAASYVGWSEFIPSLSRLAESDADVTVCEDAAILLENMKKYPARSVLPR